ncbi:MAG TPA: helix-turn-helix transcriptional regulator [Candidatus Enterenecus stercoripullorum]|nr:helix-turn-helix transcriptional regulator [Candidatus Enterenecus stercoripullorum]
MSMGSKLAQARRKHNLTQEQLAEQLGVTRQAVSRWESDTAYPETDKIVRMSEILGVSCDWLLRDGEDSPDGSAPTASPVVTRLLRQAAERRVQLTLYENEGAPSCDWCVIREFDGAWANVEFVKEKKGQRESQLIPVSSIRSIIFLKEKGDV